MRPETQQHHESSDLIDPRPSAQYQSVGHGPLLGRCTACHIELSCPRAATTSHYSCANVQDRRCLEKMSVCDQRVNIRKEIVNMADSDPKKIHYGTASQQHRKASPSVVRSSVTQKLRLLRGQRWLRQKYRGGSQVAPKVDRAQ